MGMDVAGGHARQLEPASQPLEPPVPGPVALKEGSLELDSQPLDPEGISQTAESELVLNAA